jgi:hypothetical protein
LGIVALVEVVAEGAPEPALQALRLTRTSATASPWVVWYFMVGDRNVVRANASGVTPKDDDTRFVQGLSRTRERVFTRSDRVRAAARLW